MKQRNWGYLLCGFALPCASVQAANLIQNPDFDNGLTAWDAYSTGALIDNADGTPSAPAAQLSTSPFTTTGSGLFVSQCVSLTGSPPPWDFGTRIRVVSSTGSSCQISIYSAFDTGSCALQGTNFGSSAFAGGTVAGVQGDFTQYAATTSDPMPGGGISHAAVFVVQVDCPSGSDSMTINVDHAYLGTSGTAPVRLQSFDVK